MKKLIIIIVLLIAAAGTAFYFGWVKVGPDVIGVAHSTITGTIDYPVKSGRIYWFWQKLVPKTFYLYTVQKKPAAVKTKITASLPKSEKLKDYGRFDLEIDVKVQYRIDFEAARGLLDSGILSNFHDYFADNISTRADEIMSSFIIEGLARYTDNIENFNYQVFDLLDRELENDISEYSSFYNLKDVRVSVVFIEVPQIESYVNAIKSYSKYMENFYALKEEEMRMDSEYLKKYKAVEFELGRLRKYGELISEYPDILKFLYIEKLSEKIEVVVLPQDEKTGFPKMLEHMESGKEKLFLPDETVPEESIFPSEPEAERNFSEKPVEDKKVPAGDMQKKGIDFLKYLKFWEVFKRVKN